MPDWIVYYGDGDKFTSDDGIPAGEYARDVQVVVQRNERVGWAMQHGADYYIWRDDKWLGVDFYGLIDFLLDSGLVIFGRTISNDEYQEIYQRAKSDMSAKKAAYLKSERRP